MEKYLSVKSLTNLIKYVILAIIAFFLIKWIIKKIKERNVGKQYVDLTKIDPAKNYDNLAKAVHDAFDNWVNSGEEMEGVCKQLNALNNDELKHLSNRYSEIYGKGTRTLEDAITDYYFCIGCSNCKALADRLKANNIN
jgi:flagellar biosynthesis/type III secretory pathway M-ring protein FliF/YscJ